MKIFLKFYSENNFGDDLLLYIFLNNISKKKIYTIAKSDYKKWGKKFNNLRVINRDNIIFRVVNYILFHIFQTPIEYILMKLCDINVYLGGSIFIENEDRRKNDFAWWNKFISCGNKVFLMGTNFGPYYTDQYREFFGNTFRKCEDVCFREKESYDIFSEASTSCRLVSDLAFSLNINDFDNEIKSPEIIKGKYAVINVMDIRGKEFSNETSHEVYLEYVLKIIKKFQEKNIHCVLLAMCESEGDILVCKDIYSRCNSSMTKLVTYKGNIGEIVKLLKNSEYIIASRFHAIVLGYILRKPIYAILYSSKSLNLIIENHLNIAYVRLDELNIGVSVEKLYEVLKMPIDYKNSDYLVKNAQSNFNKLAECLGGIK